VTANSYCYILNKRITSAYGTRPGNSKWDPVADVNKDCAVNNADLSLFAVNSGSDSWCYGKLNDNSLCKANLVQSVTPPPPSTPVASSVKPTFICGYYDTAGNPISGATVNVILDSNTYATAYNPSTKDYRLTGISLGIGSHPWYCSASAPIYQSQAGSTKTYPVIAPTTLTVRVDTSSPNYTISGYANPIFSADYNFTFNGVSSLVNPDNADVAVYINGVSYPTLFETSAGGDPFLHNAYMAFLSVGNNNWYFNASAPGYQTQVSPTQIYVVEYYYSQSSPNLCGYYQGTSTSCGSPNNFCVAGHYFPSRQCSNTNPSECISGYCAICGQCTGSRDTCAASTCGANNNGAEPNGCTSPNVCTGQGTGSSNCVAPGGIGAVCYCNAMCQNGNCVNNICAVATVVCPPPYCNGNGQLCTYSGPSCAVTCITCPNPNTICNPNYGKCMQICGGKNNPCPNEQAPPTPVSDTWYFAIVILAIIGLCLGYLIIKDAVSASVTSKKKKR
jgi:hypothetical protein